MAIGNLLKSKDGLIQAHFESLFRRWSENLEERRGLHASAIIQADDVFCYREQVLMLAGYKRDVIHASSKTLRIFLEGNYVHEKWQKLFTDAGIALEIEKRRYSEEWDVYLTPDAVVKLFGKTWVVEIKSMNSYGFSKLKSPPINAVRQANFYMHKLGIRRAIILVENKNDQDFKTWAIDYDPDIARPFVERLDKVGKYLKFHRKTGRLPARICNHSGVKRATGCPLRNACFFKNKRVLIGTTT